MAISRRKYVERNSAHIYKCTLEYTRDLIKEQLTLNADKIHIFLNS